jgi:hypothetical protein
VFCRYGSFVLVVLLLALHVAAIAAAAKLTQQLHIIRSVTTFTMMSIHAAGMRPALLLLLLLLLRLLLLLLPALTVFTATPSGTAHCCFDL